MKKIQTLIAALIALVVAPAFAQGAQDPVHGLWLTANGKAIVEFAPCGAKTCGRMVWVANPLDDTGALKRDVKNDDSAKRDRTICGLPLLGDLDQAKQGAWEGGWIYNPRDGSTYGADIETVSESQLKVRGYLGVSLFGKSQIWTRVTDNRGGC